MNLKELILTPADSGVFSWQIDGYMKFYGTKDKHVVRTEKHNGVGIPLYHPFESPKAFRDEFMKRIKKRVKSRFR